MLAVRTALGLVALMVALPLAAEERASGDAQAPTEPVQAAPGGSGSQAETSPPAEDAVHKPTAEEGASKPSEDGTHKSNRLVSILGREVTNRDGDGGRVIDVLIDLDGRSGAVVVEFGGFMGIGSRKVAVGWDALKFVREGDRTMLIIDVSREQIKEAPEYKPNEPTTVISTK